MAEEAILDHFRNPEHEPFHSDDLWHVIPDQHRGVISLAVMALVNKRLIVSTGVLRKSAIPSRKRSPSQEYRLTERGRDRIAGVGAGEQTRSSREARGVGSSPPVSTDPGDGSSVHGRQPAHGAGEPRPAPLPGMEDTSPPSAYDPFSEAA